VKNLLRYAMEGLAKARRDEAGTSESASPTSAAPSKGDENVVGSEAELIESVRRKSADNSSVIYAHHVFAEVAASLAQHGCRPESVLELGSGVNLGTPFCFAAAGIPRVAAIDIQPMPAQDDGFYELLTRYLSCVEGFRWWRQFATETVPGVTFPYHWDLVAWREILQSLEYHSPCSVADMPFSDGSFDAIYSIGSFEHFDDPDGTAAELYRVLSPGGLAYHQIGFMQHGSQDPLLFLEWSTEEWDKRSHRYGQGRGLAEILEEQWEGEVYCNRLRRSDVVELMTRHGLEIVEDVALIVYDEELIRRERFIEPYRSKELSDLAVLGSLLVTRKPE